ncbi:MAG TPA: ATP-binding protein [Longimicrobiaceae bacterium]|nr:ATP-binding protein [Longimicrobiaceae bacterium]
MSSVPTPTNETPAEDRLHQYIREVQKRLTELHRDAMASSSAQASGLVEELIEELYTSVEELRVSQEELREQNQWLAESQEMLAAERQRYHELFDLAPDAYLVTDLQGGIREANRAAARLLGIEQRHLPGKPLVLYVEDEDLRGLHALLATVAEKGRVEEWQLRLRPRSAPPVPVAVTATARENGDQTHGVRWLIRDISERTRAEERAQQLVREQAARELAENAARRSRVLAEASRILSSSVDYRATLRSMVHFVVPELADSIIVYMVGDDGRLQRLAAAHADPHRHGSLQQLIGARPPELDSQISPVARVIRTGKAELIPEVGAELLGVRGEASESLDILRLIDPRSLMVVPLVSAGAVFGAISLACSSPGNRYTFDDLGMAEDLASRVTLAVDNARLYAEAQQAARARQELLHVVSHDLRNSLNAALLHTELLLSSTPPAEEQERRTRGTRHVETIHRSLDQMHRLVQDLLQAETLAEGRLILQCDRQEAAPLLTEVLEMLQPVAEAKHLFLECQISETVPALYADRERLLQVFFNLVGNAIKFAPEGGRITLRADARDGEVSFAVADTGPGIAAEDLPHVFEPYWQGPRHARQGAGLGLSIARGIVEGHGGRIWVESQTGAGSTFYFTIPIADT